MAVKGMSLLLDIYLMLIYILDNHYFVVYSYIPRKDVIKERNKVCIGKVDTTDPLPG